MSPRKRWGQNYLINQGARKKIIEFLDISPNTKVWEIGSGLGAMTELILHESSYLTVFEIDPACCQWLMDSYTSQGMKLISGDVMKTWKNQWGIECPDRIAGNLPYNAASAIIASFTEAQCMPRRWVITVQEEMAHRMLASAGTKAYSSFSILCQTNYSMTDGGRLSPGSFYPVPRVQSRIIILEPTKPYGEISDLKLLQLLTRSLFHARRKTINNNLNTARHIEKFPNIDTVKSILRDQGIALNQRAETIEPEIWVALTNKLFTGTSKKPI